MRARLKAYLLTHIATAWNGNLPPPLTWPLFLWYLLKPFLRNA